MSVTVATVTVHGEQELRITGDSSANTVAIVDDGSGHVEVSDGDGNLIGSGDDIDRIRYLGKDGTDTVTYTLTNPLSRDESLFFQLGSGGDNQATLDLSQGVSGANLDVAVYGSTGVDTIAATIGAVADGHANLRIDGRAGDDVISVLGTGIDIAADGGLNVSLEGGRGDDTLSTNFDSQILGRLSYTVSGGGGADTITSELTANSGSTGKLFAKAAGGADTDNVTLNVNDNTTADSEDGASTLEAIHAAIFDPSDEDTLTFTDNVTKVDTYGCLAGGGFGGGGFRGGRGGFGGFGGRGFRF